MIRREVHQKASGMPEGGGLSYDAVQLSQLISRVEKKPDMLEKELGML